MGDTSQDGRRPAARKRRATSPDPPTAALIAQLTAEDAAALKRTRRVRPLDLDRPIPVLHEGTEDEALIKELLSMPGAPTVEDPDSIRTTADFLRMLEGNPDTAFIAAPGMVLTEFNDVPAPSAGKTTHPPPHPTHSYRWPLFTKLTRCLRLFGHSGGSLVLQ